MTPRPQLQKVEGTRSKQKLDGIESGAEVITIARSNVTAAGALMVTITNRPSKSI